MSDHEPDNTKMVQVAGGEKGLQLTGLDEMFRFAKFVCDSSLAPKGDTPSGVVVKLQAGAELGFSPMQALAALTAINGRVGIMGDGAVALIEASGVLKEPILKFVEGEGDSMMGVCTSWRQGYSEPFRTTFSASQAKKAQLWMKKGMYGDSPWVTYPDRMLQYRALGFHARDHYSDVIKGLTIAEELHDFGRIGGTVTATPVEPAQPDPLLDDAPAPVADADGVAIEPTPTEQAEIKAAEIAEANSLFSEET